MYRIETPLTNLGETWRRPGDVNHQFDSQLSQRITLGFHDTVGQSRGEYALSFDAALQDAKEHDFRLGVPVFVEPRIPVREQAALLGIDIAPSVWVLPDATVKKPYVAWLSIVPNPGIDPIDFAFQKFLKLSQERGDEGFVIELATPYEALAANVDILLHHRFVYLAGKPGVFLGQKLLALDTWQGTPRISGPDRRQYEYFTGALVATRSKELA